MTDLVYFDIETVPHHEKPSLQEVKVPNNYKNPETIRKYQEKHLMEYWKKQALNPKQGSIFCISYAINDEEPETIRAQSEEEMLEAYFAVLDDLWTHQKEVLLIAHNVKFDALWIYQRALRYGMPKMAQIFAYNNKNTIYHNFKKVCTMYLAGGGIEWNYKISLNDLANLLQLESNHKTKIDGSMIFDYWLRGETDVILDYCADDVRLLREIYKRIGFQF